MRAGLPPSDIVGFSSIGPLKLRNTGFSEKHHSYEPDHNQTSTAPKS
jgi:hypothetical protein